MKIKLTESDLSRIVRRVLNEQPEELKPIEDIGRIKTNNTLKVRDFLALGGLKQVNNDMAYFMDKSDNIWILSKEWVWQQKGVDDEVRFVVPNPSDGLPSQEFSTLFNSRKRCRFC